MENKYLLKLTVIIQGVAKHIISIITEGTHSENATMNKMLKKVTELYIEGMNLEKEPTKEELKKYHNSVVKNYKKHINYYPATKEKELEGIENVVKVEPVKAKVQKTDTVYIATNTGKKISHEMTRYKTKVESFKEFLLYIRKDKSKRYCYILTEPVSGFVLATSTTKTGIERLIKEYEERNMIATIKTKIQECYESNCILNPHLVSKEYIENVIIDKEFERNKMELKDKKVNAVINNLGNIKRILNKYEGLEGQAKVKYPTMVESYNNIKNWSNAKYHTLCTEKDLDELIHTTNVYDKLFSEVADTMRKKQKEKKEKEMNSKKAKLIEEMLDIRVEIKALFDEDLKYREENNIVSEDTRYSSLVDRYGNNWVYNRPVHILEKSSELILTNYLGNHKKLLEDILEFKNWRQKEYYAEYFKNPCLKIFDIDFDKMTELFDLVGFRAPKEELTYDTNRIAKEEWFKYIHTHNHKEDMSYEESWLEFIKNAPVETINVEQVENIEVAPVEVIEKEITENISKEIVEIETSEPNTIKVDKLEVNHDLTKKEVISIIRKGVELISTALENKNYGDTTSLKEFAKYHWASSVSDLTLNKKYTKDKLIEVVEELNETISYMNGCQTKKPVEVAEEKVDHKVSVENPVAVAPVETQEETKVKRVERLLNKAIENNEYNLARTLVFEDDKTYPCETVEVARNQGMLKISNKHNGHVTSHEFEFICVDNKIEIIKGTVLPCFGNPAFEIPSCNLIDFQTKINEVLVKDDEEVESQESKKVEIKNINFEEMELSEEEIIQRLIDIISENKVKLHRVEKLTHSDVKIVDSEDKDIKILTYIEHFNSSWRESNNKLVTVYFKITDGAISLIKAGFNDGETKFSSYNAVNEGWLREFEDRINQFFLKKKPRKIREVEKTNSDSDKKEIVDMQDGVVTPIEKHREELTTDICSIVNDILSSFAYERKIETVTQIQDNSMLVVNKYKKDVVVLCKGEPPPNKKLEKILDKERKRRNK